MHSERPRKNIWWYSLLFALLFIYRFAFRDDFRVAEIIQITLTAMADLGMIILSLRLIDWTRNRITQQLSAWLYYTSFIASVVVVYAIGVVAFYYVHYGIYRITTGL